MLGQALCSTCGEVVNKSPWTWVAERSLLSFCSGSFRLAVGVCCSWRFLRRAVYPNRFFYQYESNQIAQLSVAYRFVSALPSAWQRTWKKEAPPTAPVEEAAPKTDANAGDKDPVGEAAEERNIRIQFEEVPYSDALQRFSQMANKPLIIESPLQGTLTFYDPQPYTYQEALDVLNVILSMKGVWRWWRPVAIYSCPS